MLKENIEDVFLGTFWTKLDELIDAIAYGMFNTLFVECINDGEYLIVVDEYNDEEATVYLGHAGNTIWVQSVKSF